MFLTFCFERVVSSSSRNCCESFGRSIRWSIFLTASAPMSASNSPPYLSRDARYSSSVSNWSRFSGVGPGSTTM